ncbi:hypothetical protein FQN57_004120 [Myotisia sp. PD_48]|nr:hypothetical protein FQN57_004120 [Myotisia sp. PD_48]
MACLRDKFIEGQLLDGRFQTVAPLNHGSFGMVFLAKDTLNDQYVAIKCLTKPSASDSPCPASVDYNAEELECHNTLGSHPNLVNLVSSFETASHNFLVLEYCSMGDLYEAIRIGRGPLETEHVREFMLQLLDGVEHMHSKGLFHRDIKPENIFLSQDGSMKLGDFGLATTSTWSHEACVGSDRYMAPEQYEPTGAGYSPAQADLWSIGICLLNILFAKNPFVTPTESDILFADYTRDRQSLFDVFPNMSQDTFEILTHSLALDPKKRSLQGIREAIHRVVSFTTDDEALDDFCTEDRDIVAASANREPLRTPSIQSPHINQGDSFPWAKALQATPQANVRRLSAIPDTESYSEDLFASSEADNASWYSVQAVSPSMGSTLDSTFGNSFKSTMKLQRPQLHRPSPISESLPATAVKPIPSLAAVFGNASSNQVSKSWSDLWDEEESEAEEALLRSRQFQNARTWSQESINGKIAGLGLSEIKDHSVLNARPQVPATEEKSNAFSTPLKASSHLKENVSPLPFSYDNSGRYSPPKQQSILDKWTALGKRRQNYHPKGLPQPTPVKSPQKPVWRKDSPSDFSPWSKKSVPSRDNRSNRTQQQQQQQQQAMSHLLSKDWRRDPYQTIKPKRTALVVPNFDGATDDDFDFIGGWQDLHP